jgi:hypothetical protein
MPILPQLAPEHWMEIHGPVVTNGSTREVEMLVVKVQISATYGRSVTTKLQIPNPDSSHLASQPRLLYSRISHA